MRLTLKEQGPSVEEQTLATLQEIRDELKRANGSAELSLNWACNGALPHVPGIARGCRMCRGHLRLGDAAVNRACFVASVELHGEYA